MKKYLIILSSLTITLLYSCKHDSTFVLAPEVNINAPLADSTYNNGDTIEVNVALYDGHGLHEADIYFQTDGGDTLFSFSPSVHDMNTYNLDTTFILAGITLSQDAFLKVKAENHENGSTSKQVRVIVAP